MSEKAAKFERLIKFHPPSKQIWDEFSWWIEDQNLNSETEKYELKERMITSIDQSAEIAKAEFESIKEEVRLIEAPFKSGPLNEAFEKLGHLDSNLANDFKIYVQEIGEEEASLHLGATMEALEIEHDNDQAGIELLEKASEGSAELKGIVDKYGITRDNAFKWRDKLESAIYADQNITDINTGCIWLQKFVKVLVPADRSGLYRVAWNGYDYKFIETDLTRYIRFLCRNEHYKSWDELNDLGPIETERAFRNSVIWLD